MGRQKFRLVVISIWLTLLGLLRMGFQSVVRAVFSAVVFAGFWFILIIQRDFIVGVTGISLGTFVIVPMSYHFDKVGQIVACTLMLVGNVGALAVFRLVHPMTGELVWRPTDVNRGMFTVLTGIVLGLAIVMSFNDVSHKVFEELRLMNEKLENNTREKEAFFATVSHEIRNPLQSMLGSVELLQDRRMREKQETADSLLGICKNCSEVVLNLVSNILDMSKIAAERMQLSPVPTDLREIVNKVFRISEAKAGAKNIALRLMDDRTLPPSIELDPQRLEQIILNLVSNAIKFTNVGKVIVKLSWFPLVASQAVSQEQGLSGDSHAELEQEKLLVQEALRLSSWKETMEFAEKEAANRVGLQRKYKQQFPPSLEAGHVVISNENAYSPATVSPPHQLAGRIGVVKMEIMDTGIGISKENAAKLFHAYQQAEESISRYCCVVLI